MSARALYGVLKGKQKRMTDLSPRRSITYALTPPGILTSTRTSTRENALKQLRVVGNGSSSSMGREEMVRRLSEIGPRRTHQKQPFLTFQVGPFVNHACGSSIEYVSELM